MDFFPEDHEELLGVFEQILHHQYTINNCHPFLVLMEEEMKLLLQGKN
jgi:hypothetical protein